MERSSGRPVTAAAAYHRAFETLPAVDRVALVFEAAVRFAKDAKLAIEQGAIERRFEATERVRAIVRTLDSALDRERGGEIADNLGRMYRYIEYRLTLINTRNDAGIAAEVVALLEELGRPWRILASMGGRLATMGETKPAPRDERVGISVSA